jgi:hypothetical protein
VLLASHSRVCRINALATVYLELNEPLLVLGKCVERLPFSTNFASIPSKCQSQFVMDISLGKNPFILDWDGRLSCPGRCQLVKWKRAEFISCCAEIQPWRWETIGKGN